MAGVNLLAIDTATEACSAAVLRADGAVFAEFEVAPRRHATLLPKMMDAVLTAAGVARGEIDYCAFANGPGAFTGIRIAAAQAQGIGVALGIPLLPVSTLALLAQTQFERSDSRKLLAALDARMQEIYWAVFRRGEDGCAEPCGDERLGAVATVQIPGDIDIGVGHGWVDELRARATCPCDPELLPDARALLSLARRGALAGAAVAADRITINYLRQRVAEKAQA